MSFLHPMARVLMLAACVLASLVLPAGARQLRLDEGITANRVTFYPSHESPDSWYYVPDHPRIAMEGSRPQFSFLKYTGDGASGGIIHLMVELGVPEATLRKASAALRRLRPGARVEGPLTFGEGQLAVVTTVADAKTIVGVGNAPLLSGARAAVSIPLTKRAADILWEQFDMNAPDISLSFEMRFDGLGSPVTASVIAELDQVFKHRAFQGSVAGLFYEAEIDAAMDSLVTNQVIRVEQVGEDESVANAVKEAKAAVKSFLFAPAKMTIPTTPKQGNRAAQAFTTMRKQEMAMLSRECREIDSLRARALQAGDQEAQAGGSYDTPKLRELRARYDRAKDRVERLAKRVAHLQGGSTGTSSASPRPPARGTSASRERPARGTGKGPLAKLAEAGANAPGPKGNAKPSAKATPKKGNPKTENPAPAPAADAKPAPKAATNAAALARARKEHAAAKAELEGARHAFNQALGSTTDPDRAGARLSKARGAGTDARAKLAACEQARDGIPSFYAAASLKLRKVERRGRFEMSLKKWRPRSQAHRFDVNVGTQLARYRQDERVFARRNIEDPMNELRPVNFLLTETSNEDFGRHLQFVSVEMRKTHEDGTITRRSARIDAKAFAEKGGLVEMQYGWRDDDDTKRWLQYEHRAVWHFRPGIKHATDWTTTDESDVDLTPPLELHQVSIDADPDRLAEEGVRLVTARVYFKAGAKERVEQVQLDPAKDLLSARVGVPTAGGAPEFDYEVLWTFDDGSRASTGRLHGIEQTIAADPVL